MQNSSLLTGRTWYWRKGRGETPIGSDPMYKWELCLPVHESELDGISKELQQEEILLESKVTRSGSKDIPARTFILYQTAGDVELTSIEGRNNHPDIQKLKGYIQKVGGKINQEKDEKSISLKGLFSRFFSGRG